MPRSCLVREKVFICEMVLWRSQADEIEALRAEVRNLRGEMAAQQAELEEMDTLVERMVRRCRALDAAIARDYPRHHDRGKLWV
jgi:ribosomal 50S subunit-associated protein YjgA (DUF615 family)